MNYDFIKSHYKGQLKEIEKILMQYQGLRSQDVKHILAETDKKLNALKFK